MTDQIQPTFIFARYNESMVWLKNHPLIYKNCIIYNKGNRKLLDNELKNILHQVSIIDIPNFPIFGRESDTYLQHIINNFNLLNEYIVFSQANPFTHNPFFVETIQYLYEFNLFKNYQPLTYCWKSDENVPPIENVLYDKSYYCGPYKIYMETINSSMQPVGFHDKGIEIILKPFREKNKITSPEKTLFWIYESLNLTKPYCGFLKFNYGSIFGVSKKNILQNSLELYKKLHEFVNLNRENGFILERLWYTICS